LTVLSVAIQRYLTVKYLLPQDNDYQAFVANSYIIRGLFSWLMIAFVSIISWIWYYLQDQQAIDRRQEDAEKLAREAELSKLRQQLQPHFLFNSLNSISALAGSRPEEARKMIQQLSDFLRGTLKKDDQQLVTLSEELQHLELYLDIEKVRFGHRLKTEINKADNTENMALPSLLLQPLVENAIKFGLYDTIGTITIRITAKTENNYLIIEIENPFDPSTTQPKGTGFGLNSVQRRLHLLYARQDLLTTQQNDSLFITSIKIPQSK
jgi:LytS/YehU family sensor histidine kinase